MRTNKGLFALALGSVLAVGCGSTGEEEGTASPTAGTPASKVAVTIEVDTTFSITGGDGSTQALAAVLEGESVYVVGNFGDANGYPTWDPQASTMAMTKVSEGLWSITLALDPASALEFKFTKTTSDASNGWANGEKDYELASNKACEDPNAPAGAPAYLHEVANRTYTVAGAAGDEEKVNTVVEAWRDYAVNTYGLPTCY